MNESPPPGIIGYGVFTAAGVRQALLIDRAQAEGYAARIHGYCYPLICPKRKEDALLFQLPENRS